MGWWKRVKWWLHVYREVGRLQAAVTAQERLIGTMGKALDDCARASQEESTRLNAEIYQLAVRLTMAQAPPAPLARYTAADQGVQVAAVLIPAVEAAKVGVYRSQDKMLIMVTYKPLPEEESAGWELLGTDEAIKELRRRERMAMGVWN